MMGVPVNQLPEDLAGDIQERDLEDGKKLQLAPSPVPTIGGFRHVFGP